MKNIKIYGILQTLPRLHAHEFEETGKPHSF